MQKIKPLPFEKQFEDIEKKIEELKILSKKSEIDLNPQIEKLTNEANKLKDSLYENLKPYEKVQIARHPMRPTFLDYVGLIAEDFVEFRGDRKGFDDRSIIGGIAKFEGQTVMFVGTQKGKNTKENLEYNFGMPQPEGYRKAMRLFLHAQKFKMPIITLIDTPGAYPGMKAEEHGQGIAIAENLRDMMSLTVPTVSVITGEGCSGGALGLAVTNKVFMLENSYYTVISPEGCASILWNDASFAPLAADKLKITAQDLSELGIIDGIIPEPRGGAHQDVEQTAKNLKSTLSIALEELSKLNKKEILSQRFEKFRNF